MIFVGLALGLLAASCSSVSAYRYQPDVAEVAWNSTADPSGATAEETWGRSFAQVAGFTEGSNETYCRVRLRVENPGGETLQVVESEFGLLDGDLGAFQVPRVQLATGEGWSVAPGGAVVADLEFPVPDDGVESMNLDVLTFRWAVRKGVELHPTNAIFRRRRQSVNRNVGFQIGPTFSNRFYDPFCRPGFGYYYPWF